MEILWLLALGFVFIGLTVLFIHKFDTDNPAFIFTIIGMTVCFVIYGIHNVDYRKNGTINHYPIEHVDVLQDGIKVAFSENMKFKHTLSTEQSMIDIDIIKEKYEFRDWNSKNGFGIKYYYSIFTLK